MKCVTSLYSVNGCLLVNWNCGFGFDVCWFDVVDVVESLIVEEVVVAVFGLVDF